MALPYFVVREDRSMNDLQCKVIEARSQDVGRCFVRLDPQDIIQLNANIGDIVEIIGKRRTLGKLMPTHKEHRGQKKVQIDGITRENAQVSIDDYIVLRKSSYVAAEEIKIAPINYSPCNRDLDYIGNRLDGIPVVLGDKIRSTMFGNQPADFKITHIVPTEPAIIHSTTQLKIEKKTTSPQKKNHTTHSYEDIGGLANQLQRIRETIEFPLRYPQMFTKLGISAPRGVLLYGPPGCGKTLIAKAVARETDAYFEAINGPEIIHKFYGESEAHLRSIFERAQSKSPAIIFIDEIDAIAPRRENVVGEVEKRVVATLLALMDGLSSGENIIVIAATNIPNALDPALRRPGRFDREISISVPDKKGREEILNIHSRGMPLAQDIDLTVLAELTNGFVGADLEAVCREAAMICLRSLMKEVDFELDRISYHKLETIAITKKHFDRAMLEIKPSVTREVAIEIPKTTWDEIGGLHSVKNRVRKIIEWPTKYSHLFQQSQLKPSKGILLVGPPGCGKTLLAMAIANNSNHNFISIKGPALLSKYLGESEREIRKIFHKACLSSPCIIYFDEIDALIPKRSSEAKASARILSQFLAELDGIEKVPGLFILGSTNRIDMLDSAAIRPGRFDEIIKIESQNEEERHEIFAIHLKNKPLAAEIDIKALAKNTPNFSGAEIAEVCHRATWRAMENNIENGQTAKLEITISNFNDAIAQIKQEKQYKTVI